jgi:catechol 2,3-dioxygenase-like lactoylglutathione lyase family enzyme
LQQATPASLHHLHVVSENPARLIEFYRRLMDMSLVMTGGPETVLVGPNRAMTIVAAGNGAQPYWGFALKSETGLAALRRRLEGNGTKIEALASPLFQPGAFLVSDPQGRRMGFGLAADHGVATGMPGRLQHTVFQTTELEPVVRFYTENLGFTISDEVVDTDDTIKVVFMRSDDEHHSLAFFQGSRNEWDHHCYETNEWNDIRDWGDRFAAAKVPIFFGPGRHGPGRNLFFMVNDPDGNRVELSAELEIVPAGTEPGTWPHAETTLNTWGSAWIRS